MNRLTRRRTGGLLAICAFLAGGIAVAADTPKQQGTFALLGASAQTTAELRVTPSTGGIADARVRLFTTNNKPIVNFTLDMQRVMHIVVVRDDFATFEHLHPAMDVTTGTFHQTVKGLDPNHRYYLYSDSVPSGLTEQVFRFTLQGNNIAAVAPASTLAASATSVTAGPYVVQLSTTTLTAGKPMKLSLEIKEHGKPASNLGPYLGVAAHVVMVDAQSLAYLHLHALIAGTSMADAMKDATHGNPQSGPYLEVDLPALPAGSYKVWIQFLGGPLNVYTAPFTLVAE